MGKYRLQIKNVFKFGMPPHSDLAQHQQYYYIPHKFVDTYTKAHYVCSHSAHEAKQHSFSEYFFNFLLPACMIVLSRENRVIKC